MIPIRKSTNNESSKISKTNCSSSRASVIHRASLAMRHRRRVANPASNTNWCDVVCAPTHKKCGIMWTMKWQKCGRTSRKQRRKWARKWTRWWALCRSTSERLSMTWQRYKRWTDTNAGGIRNRRRWAIWCSDASVICSIRRIVAQRGSWCVDWIR